MLNINQNINYELVGVSSTTRAEGEKKMEQNNTNPTTEDTSTGVDTQNDTLSLTKDELAAMLQKETDRRVTTALAKAKKSWETEIGTKMDSHLKDYERKAQMTPEQLKQLDIEDKFKMLEAKEKQYQTMIRKVEITEKLQNKKLSTVLAEFVYDEDMEVVEQKITTLEQLVLGMVNEEVEKRINSSKPKASVNTAGLDKESFQKLSIAERSELYRTNPSLYNQLSK